MTITLVILLLFLGLGLVTRKYNTWTRLLLIAMIVGMILLLYYT